MTDVIHLLPDHVANQIAAGEVVQRPASVIKELLENSIDAGATRISVVIKDAGKTLIQVVDDGQGMSPSDARVCFERHATSKIKTADDLFRLQTKGFRGEALASIAAIAHVELKTRREQDQVGTSVKIEGSEVVSQEPCVAPKGTSISVKNLFYNIPARRNFLKSDSVETRHLIDEFQRVALAHPAIHFTFTHNGTEFFQLPATNYRQRIVGIFGGKTNEKLVPVKEDTEIVKIHGFVGKPEFAKRSRGEQFFFVNDRFIKSPYLHHAVTAAFEGLLKDKAHPSYFIYLSIDPKSIDINIHPTKTEVKFDDEQALYSILRSTIKHSLGQFSVAPVLDFDRDASFDTPYSFKDKPIEAPKIEVDRNFNPFDQETRPSSYSSSGYRKEPRAGEWEGLYTGLQEHQFDTAVSQLDQVEFESEQDAAKLFEDETQEHLENSIFQLNRKFIVSSLKTGLLVIDQHRAHVRILYEELLKNITVSAAVSQQLLFPLELSFSHREMELLAEARESLEQAGFIFSTMEAGNVQISGIPTPLSESEVPALLHQLLADLENEVPDTGFAYTDTLAKSLAEGMAVKAGVRLSTAEQQNLLNALFACKESSVTPNNKPIFITLSVDEIDKKFI